MSTSTLKIVLGFFITALTFTEAKAQKHFNCSNHNKPHSAKAMVADNSRSDSLDIKSIDLHLDFTQFSQQVLRANATIQFEALMDNIHWINLDLLDFTVDSVKVGSENLEFTYTSPLLGILLPEMNSGDIEEISVYYQGTPPQDASGWGGFYWNNAFAFNLGVGFAADPHNYGRAWFPCFDNFVERSTYSFTVLTDQGKRAICNGERLSEEQVGQDSLLTTWSLEDEIPSYLASIAVGNYSDVNQSVESISGNDIPILLAAPPEDTTAVKNSFVNLPDAVEGFEEDYGPYLWNRVGFVFVPFSGGAMEHATNIAYPLSLVNGSQAYETLMAHELSHHWWGDLVTCRTAEDMWINEGLASYSEALFLESVYGYSNYIDHVRDNHKDVLLFAHQDDGGEHRAVSGVPHEYTYGSHVYNKGADVSHNLRTYLGDEDFFDGLTGFLQDNAFSDVSSEDLRDYLEQVNDADMQSFFDNWIFEPGFPEFSIDSVQITQTFIGYEIVLFIPQKLHFAPEYYENVPLEVTVMDEFLNTETHEITVSGEYSIDTIYSTIDPQKTFLNFNNKLNQAVLAENQHIGDTGNDNFDYAEFRVSIDELATGDSLWIRVENHLVGPHQEQPQAEYHISTDRFWRIDGFFPESLVAAGRVHYKGDPDGSLFLDPTFFETMEDEGLEEDSLILLYRESPSHLWQELSSYELQPIGSSTDFVGWIDFDGLQPGDYAWAFKTGETSVHGNPEKTELVIYPNPAGDEIKMKSDFRSGTIQIVDLNGKILLTEEVNFGEKILNLSGLSAGTYILRIQNSSGNTLSSKQFVKD